MHIQTYGICNEQSFSGSVPDVHVPAECTALHVVLHVCECLRNTVNTVLHSRLCIHHLAISASGNVPVLPRGGDAHDSLALWLREAP